MRVGRVSAGIAIALCACGGDSKPRAAGHGAEQAGAGAAGRGTTPASPSGAGRHATSGAGGAALTAGSGGQTSGGASNRAGSAEDADAGESTAAGGRSTGGTAGRLDPDAGAPSGGASGDDDAGGGVEDDGSIRVEHPSLPLDEPVARGGARLRRRFAVGGDGSRHFVGWHDAELGFDCEFRALGDLTAPSLRDVYCAPTATASEVSTGEACSPVATFPADCGFTGPPQYVTGETPAPNFPYQPVWRAVYEIQDAEATTPCTGYGEDRYPATAVSPSALARAELVHLDLGDDIWLDRLEAEDGATEARSFAYKGLPCTPTEIGPGESRCLQVPIGSTTTYFTDSACTEGGVGHFDSAVCGQAAALVVRPLNAQSCSEVTMLGPGTAAPPLYWDVAESCEPGSWPDGQGLGYCILGEPAEHSLLPAVELTTSGTTRLRNKTQRMNGSSVTLRELLDSELDTTCSPAPVAGGGLRCLPKFMGSIWDPPYIPVYERSDCKTPVPIAAPCSNPEYFAGISDSACRAWPESAWRVKGLLPAGAGLYLPDGPSCTFAPSNLSLNGFELYDVEATDFASFAPLTVEIE